MFGWSYGWRWFSLLTKHADKSRAKCHNLSSVEWITKKYWSQHSYGTWTSKPSDCMNRKRFFINVFCTVYLWGKQHVRRSEVSGILSQPSRFLHAKHAKPRIFHLQILFITKCSLNNQHQATRPCLKWTYQTTFARRSRNQEHPGTSRNQRDDGGSTVTNRGFFMFASSSFGFLVTEFI